MANFFLETRNLGSTHRDYTGFPLMALVILYYLQGKIFLNAKIPQILCFDSYLINLKSNQNKTVEE